MLVVVGNISGTDARDVRVEAPFPSPARSIPSASRCWPTPSRRRAARMRGYSGISGRRRRHADASTMTAHILASRIQNAEIAQAPAFVPPSTSRAAGPSTSSSRLCPYPTPHRYPDMP